MHFFKDAVSLGKLHKNDEKNMFFREIRTSEKVALETIFSQNRLAEALPILVVFETQL